MTDRFTPTRIERFEVDADVSKILNFIDQFSSSTAGFTAYFAGLSVEEAKAIGARTADEASV